MSIDKHQQLKDRTKMFAWGNDVGGAAQNKSSECNHKPNTKIVNFNGSQLLSEANQLMLIFSALRRTAKA